MSEFDYVQYVTDGTGKRSRARDVGHDLETSVIFGRPPTFYNYTTFTVAQVSGRWLFYLYNNVPNTVMTVEKFFINLITVSTTVTETNVLFEFRKIQGLDLTVQHGTFVPMDETSSTFTWPDAPYAYGTNSSSEIIPSPTSSSILWDTPTRLFKASSSANMSEWIFTQQANLIPASYRLTNLSLGYQEGLGILQSSALTKTTDVWELSATSVITMEGV